MESLAVHDGKFQADEVFAAAILKLINPEINIIRTRKQEIFDKADIRIDVGMKYNHKTRDYDHHQKEGAGTRPNNIPYASGGLIWKHYGDKLTNSKEAFEYIDKILMQPIDAMDNGMNIYNSEIINPFTISDVINLLNPNWKEKNPDYDKQFMKAVSFAEEILKRIIEEANSIKEIRDIVKKAKKFENGKILLLEKPCPWREIVVNETKALFVIMPRFTNKTYNIHAVPIETSKFANRKNLPKEWAGLEFEELAKVSGIKDSVFCHRNLFIAGTKTKESAIKMAKRALNE